MICQPLGHRWKYFDSPDGFIRRKDTGELVGWENDHIYSFPSGVNYDGFQWESSRSIRGYVERCNICVSYRIVES